MPYEVVDLGKGKCKIIDKDTGNVHSGVMSRDDAEAQVRLLHKVESDTKPRTTKDVMGSRPAAEGSKD